MLRKNYEKNLLEFWTISHDLHQQMEFEQLLFDINIKIGQVFCICWNRNLQSLQPEVYDKQLMNYGWKQGQSVDQ